MTTEQDGAPSASAGGAPAPILDLSAFEKAGRLLAAAWLEQQAARAAYWRGLFGGLSANQEPHAMQEVDRSTCPNCWGDLLPDPRDAEIERLRDQLGEVCTALHNQLSDYDECGVFTRDHALYLVRQLGGRVRLRDMTIKAIQEMTRPSSLPDQRGIEIEQLRKRLAYDLGLPSDEVVNVSLVELLQRLKTMYMTALDEARSRNGDMRAEVEELETQRDDQAVGIEHWKGLAETLGAQVDEHARSIRELVAERDRKRRELVDVTAERDRLRQESGSLFRKLCAALDVNPAGETWASFVTRVGALVGERDEAREEWKRADAERYRLRQELDDIRPRVVGIARALGLSASEEGVVKQWISRSVSEPAEPRRWVAGDPEPEPGVTVTTSGWSNGLTWTLRRNGTWHMNNCPTDPEECPTPGTTWGVLLREHGELVEVVSTDG